MSTEQKSNLELKIKPDVVFTIAAASMAGTTFIIASFTAPLLLRLILGGLLALAGIYIIQIAGVSFRRARTTVRPDRPEISTSLITTEIYGITRNPIYLGMTLILLGWATFLLNLASFGIVLFFVAYIWRFQIVPEERALTLLFKNKYKSYKSKVPRWL